MTEVFTTHNFLYTLYEEGRVAGHRVIFLNRDNQEQSITLSAIEIGSNPLSCRLFDQEGKRYIVPFLRIRYVYWENTLVWDNSDADLSNTQIIPGHKKREDLQ
jgi:hypothetical protein